MSAAPFTCGYPLNPRPRLKCLKKSPCSVPTILVIDDSEATAFSIRSAVPECEVLHARDGIEGLDIFRQHTDEIDLIVLDIQMPYLDGRATCIKIRSTKKDIPIVPF